ncbi:hypothetical protein CAPTEDRAFT_200634 [Capitella teleta]|uniref:Uncharacterized protein n=1 Tax=Capitella teleta TaxID=283909 RepID=R7TWE5_CAPTE|nr:hypothetical protein CAPTEDRAFT_200634 [Capitella teleta]|eukprot:ELT98238.1 hypothetical protein CAPTEDRAFT_200634 [Capitella teleta]
MKGGWMRAVVEGRVVWDVAWYKRTETFPQIMSSNKEEISEDEEETPNLKRKNISNEKRTCKKARHPWQIKGSRNCSPASSSTSTSSSTSSTSSTPQPSSSFNTAPDSSEDDDATPDRESHFLEITNAVKNQLPVEATPATNVRRLSYIERWQCQHVAKATVDNAINQTLEEMALSPNAADNSRYQEQRSRIENEGVSQAILLQGLQRQRPPLRQWSPIIARLTQISEMIFSVNMRSRRSVAEAFVRGDPDLTPLVPDESNDHGWREGRLEEAPPAAPNFLLDQAVIAAMTEQGLQRR